MPGNQGCVVLRKLRGSSSAGGYGDCGFAVSHSSGGGRKQTKKKKVKTSKPVGRKIEIIRKAADPIARNAQRVEGGRDFLVSFFAFLPRVNK